MRLLYAIGRNQEIELKMLDSLPAWVNNLSSKREIQLRGVAMRPRSPDPHCLIVEDEVLVGMDLEDALSQAGFAVRWVASPDIASALLATDRPDVVVLDIVLRDRSCTALACELRRRGIPIVVHSGYAAAEAPDGLAGVPWLEKPADMATLLAAVSAVLPPGPRSAPAVTA